MRPLILSIKKYFLLAVMALMLQPSCKEIDSQIPEVPVNLLINLSIYNELTVPGNSILIKNLGFGGVIIYCQIQGTYYAYDAACTNEINQSCTIENKGVLGTCSCCKSKFILSGSAYPSEGPAKAPLKQYNVSVLGNNSIRVYN